MHCMLDLETLGTQHNAVVLAIGAVAFDPVNTRRELHRFYVTIHPKSCVQFGLTMDADTVVWWMQPERAVARDRMMASIAAEGVDLPTALEGFSMWCKQQEIAEVWGNGATFDNVILRSAYKSTGQDCPWEYYNDRCYRTEKNNAPNIKLVRLGDHHNAVDDAMSQAIHLQNILKALRITL